MLYRYKDLPLGNRSFAFRMLFLAEKKAKEIEKEGLKRRLCGK